MTVAGVPPIYVVAAGHAHPPTELTTAELEASIPSLEPGWVARYLGIESRRVLVGDAPVSDLAVDALRGALDSVRWDGSQLDAIICGTSFVDQVNPATASLVARDVAPDAIAFDMNAACASLLYALRVTSALMVTAPGWDRAAICIAEHPTAWADYTNPHSCVYWGDAAGALLLSTERPAQGFEIVDVQLVNDNEFPERVLTPRGGTFGQDGPWSYAQVLRLTDIVVAGVLRGAQLEAADVVRFVGHQASPRLLADLGARLGFPDDRQWQNVTWAGNQGAAGVLTAFSAGWQRDIDSLRDGDHVVLASVGAGLTSGAVLLRWIGDS